MVSLEMLGYENSAPQSQTYIPMLILKNFQTAVILSQSSVTNLQRC
jgi:hypothetical protein